MIKRFLILSFIPVCFFFCACNGKDDAASNNKAASQQEKKESPVVYPALTASVDRNKVHVGDIISLTLKFRLPEGSAFSEAGISGLDGLTITGKRPERDSLIFSIIIDKQKSFEVNPVSFSFKDKNGVLNIIKTEAIKIEVLSNLGDKPAEAQLKPIMDIFPTYPFILRLLPWILGLLILAAVGAAIYYFKKRRRKALEALREMKPPHIIAKEELEKLKAMNLIEKGKHKEFYFRFSEILRQYLESLRGFPAGEMTTEEISRKIKDDRDRKLVNVLRGADLVKFADAIPVKAKNDEDISVALDYIEATKPAENVRAL